MKPILAFAGIVSLAIGAFADIQDPPGNDYGPTRKLGRGISNLIIAPTEFFVTVNQINQTEGNSAGAGTTAISRCCLQTFRTSMAVMRNFRLKSVTSRNTRTCAIRTTISIRFCSAETAKPVDHPSIGGRSHAL